METPKISKEDLERKIKEIFFNEENRELIEQVERTRKWYLSMSPTQREMFDEMMKQEAEPFLYMDKEEFKTTGVSEMKNVVHVDPETGIEIEITYNPPPFSAMFDIDKCAELKYDPNEK